MALFAATGCGLLGGSTDSGGGANPKGLESPTLKAAVEPLPDFAPFYEAKKKGYFKQAGLNIKTINIQSGSQAIPDVKNGSADVAGSNWVSAITAQDHHAANLKFVAPAYQGGPGSVVVDAPHGSKIRGPKDLAGKTVGVNTKNDIVALGFKEVLKAHGVDPNQVHFVIVPFPNGEQALKSHQVDAVTQAEPFLTKTQRDLGAKPVQDVFPADSPTSGLWLSGYVSSSSWAKKNPKTLKAFQRALAKGARDCARRSTVTNLIPTYSKIDKTTAHLMSLGSFPTAMSTKQLQRVSNLMSLNHMVPKKFDVKPYVATSPSS